MQVDDTALFDYSLFFVSCLHDYYATTKDFETLQELFPTAKKQIELALNELDEKNIVTDKKTWWSFIDWAEGLNKQASSQAILIYALKQVKKIATWLNDTESEKFFDDKIKLTTDASIKFLWDEDKKFFVSGEEN